MYGPTPSMIIDKLESPPPENIFKMPKNWLLARNRLSSTVSMPGIGIAASNLNTIKAAKTNKTLFLKILSVQINFILLQIRRNTGRLYNLTIIAHLSIAHTRPDFLLAKKSMITFPVLGT